MDYSVRDIRDDGAYARLAEREFDVICQFLALETGAVQRDITESALLTRSGDRLPSTIVRLTTRASRCGP